MPQVPSNWALANSPLLIRTQQMVSLLLNDIAYFVDVNDLSAGPAVGANFTMLHNGIVPDLVARVLCCTMFNANLGAARTVALRITGVNQFGTTVQETVDFSTGAGAVNTTYGKATRWAYRYVTSITFLSRTGTVQANDRVDVGIANASATFAGTILDNGNGLTTNAEQCKGFGLAVPLGVDQTVGAVLAADFPSQIAGIAASEDGTTGVTTYAAISKANEFNIDLPFAVMVPDEVLMSSGTGVAYLMLDIQTNRGE